MKVGDLVYSKIGLAYAVIIEIWGGDEENRKWQQTHVTLSSGEKVWAGYVEVISESR